MVIGGFFVTGFAGENLLPNEKMEAITKEGKAFGWWGESDAKVDLEETPEEGYNSLHVTDGKMVQISVAVKGGGTYDVSYLLKTKEFITHETFVSFQILWAGKGKYLMMDYKGNQIWNMKIEDTTTTLDWKPVSWTCTAPADADRAYIRILQKGKVEKSSFWIAKMRMEEKIPATENEKK